MPEDQENYRWFGETVLIVRGRLISGGWQCDKCNAPLNVAVHTPKADVY